MEICEEKLSIHSFDIIKKYGVIAWIFWLTSVSFYITITLAVGCRCILDNASNRISLAVDDKDSLEGILLTW